MRKAWILLFVLLFSSVAPGQTSSELLERIERLEREVSELRRMLVQRGVRLDELEALRARERSPWAIGVRKTVVQDVLVAPGPETSETTSFDTPLGKSQLVRLEPGKGCRFLVQGGTRFKLRARIDYPSAAGAAFVMKVTNDGKPLGPLLNKSMEFTYSDGRSFPYCRPDGTYNVFYRPDFVQNDSSQSSYRLTNSQGQAYVYEWSVPGSGQVEIFVQHGRLHEGQEVSHPLMLELLSPTGP